jgi:hypothetical protein
MIKKREREKGGWGLAQVLQCLPYKCKVINPSPNMKKGDEKRIKSQKMKSTVDNHSITHSLHNYCYKNVPVSRHFSQRHFM